MTEVLRDQFEKLSDLQVRHIPTGATFSTYRYDKPSREKIGSSLMVNWGRAGDRLDNGDEYERDAVGSVAVDLLTEMALQGGQ